MTAPLRIVMLTAVEYHCRYVVNRLASWNPLQALVLEGAADAHPAHPCRDRAARLWRYVRRRLCPRPEEQAEQRRNLERTRRFDRLMGDGWRAFDWSRTGRVLRLPLQGINLPEVRELIRDLAPDVVVVFGTTILREPLLANIPGICVNIHSGLTPWYRGTHSAQWALLNDDAAGIGVTLHYVRPQLDAGEIILQGRPALDESDTLASIELKLHVEGARLLLTALQHLVTHGRLPGVSPDRSVGTCYRRAQMDDPTRARLAHMEASGELARLLRALPAALRDAPAIVERIGSEKEAVLTP